jgi:hypothetical protein
MQFKKPTFTQVPNRFLDFEMAELNGSELKVMMFFMRQTYGFGKTWCAYSIKQICEGIKVNGKLVSAGTKLSSHSVVTAIKSLVDKGHILKRQGSWEDNISSQYCLNLCQDDESSVAESTTVIEDRSNNYYETHSNNYYETHSNNYNEVIVKNSTGLVAKIAISGKKEKEKEKEREIKIIREDGTRDSRVTEDKKDDEQLLFKKRFYTTYQSVCKQVSVNSYHDRDLDILYDIHGEALTQDIITKACDITYNNFYSGKIKTISIKYVMTTMNNLIIRDDKKQNDTPVQSESDRLEAYVNAYKEKQRKAGIIY